MANDKGKASSGNRGGDKVNSLREFQDAVMDLVTKVPNAIIKAAGNDPDAQLVITNIDTVQNIFRKTFKRMNTEFDKSSTLVQNEVIEFLDISNGTLLARSVQERAVSVFATKLLGGNIWQWLSQNLTEIKKIVGMILGLFSAKLKKWWDDLAVIIDQIVMLILSLLSSVFGFNKVAVARDLSHAEVNHLNEMAALARLKSASSYSDENDET